MRKTLTINLDEKTRKFVHQSFLDEVGDVAFHQSENDGDRWQADLVVIDWNVYLESISDDPLNDLAGKPAVFFHIPKVPQKLDQLQLVLEYRKNVLGALPLPSHQIEQWMFLKSFRSALYFLKERNRFRFELESLSSALKLLTNDVEKEVQRVKGIHRKLIPRRFDEIKGVKVHGKFLAGEFPGGEYFDIFKSGHDVLLMMCSSNSYLLSSAFISSFFAVKQSREINNRTCQELVKSLEADYKHISELDPAANREFLIVHVNLYRLKVQGFVLGNYRAITSVQGRLWEGLQSSSGEGLLEFSESLERGERIAFFSPGLIKNWSIYVEDSVLEQFFEEQMGSDLIDFIEEVMIKLLVSTGKEFLDYDASSVALEVSRHVIVEV